MFRSPELKRKRESADTLLPQNYHPDGKNLQSPLNEAQNSFTELDQRSLRSAKPKPPKCKPHEKFAQRIAVIEKRAVLIEKERSEMEKLINIEDFFQKEE
jgi:hypothetical protein